MQLRLLQIYLPDNSESDSEELLEGKSILGRWHDANSQLTILNLLVLAEETEAIMDAFDQRFSRCEGFHLILYQVEAVLPRPEPEPDDGTDEAEFVENAETDETERNNQRVSREELYTQANESLGINRVFLGMTILSAIVSAIGLLRDDDTAIIGAMVIAPLLGPNVAMALATTLGDTGLLRRASRANLAGCVSAFLFAVAVGTVFPIDLEIPAITERTRIGLGDVMLALAAGSAGTLAFTSGQAGAVIGVMVAVALIPPVVVSGMLLGSGHTNFAFGAFMLVAANIICINLAGVVTFLVQGVRPRSWWEAEKAKKAVRKAVTIWTILLVLLLILLRFSKIGFEP